MNERNETAAERAARLLTQSKATEAEEPGMRRTPPEFLNTTGTGKRDFSERNPKRMKTRMSSMIHEKGTSVSYSASNISPEFNVVPPLVISGPLKRFLITVAVLAVISLSVIFYVTIKTFRGHQYPVKSIEQRNYRFR
jgi:hypothetical protein